MKYMTDKRVGLGILVSVIAQILLISILAYSHVLDNMTTGGSYSQDSNLKNVLLVSLPLIVPSVFMAYFVYRYRYLLSVWRKHKNLTAVFFAIFIYVLSIFVFLNGNVIVG